MVVFALQNPVHLLLRLACTYVTHWEEDSKAFLASSYVNEALQLVGSLLATAHLLCSAATLCTCTSPNSKTQQLVLQGRVLQRCLELYFQTRLIRVRCDALCTQLRQLAWVLAVSPLLRAVLSSGRSNSQVEACDAALAESRVRRLVHPTVAELLPVVQYGTLLFPHTAAADPDAEIAKPNVIGDTSSDRPVTLESAGQQLTEWLSAHLTTAKTALNTAEVCVTPADAGFTWRRMSGVITAGVVRVDDEFSFAKVRCLLRPTSKAVTAVVASAGDRENVGQADNANTAAAESRSVAAVMQSAPAVVQPVDPTFEENGSAQGEGEAVYCWCRRGDDGTSMVGCDGCEEWFHCACVGVTGSGTLNGGASQLKGRGKSRNNRSRGAGGTTKRGQHAADVEAVRTDGTVEGQAGSQVQAEQQEDDAAYLCISCCTSNGKEYPYRW
jgi:hypothetical protein